MSTVLSPATSRSRLHPADLLRVGSVGLVTRRVRAALSGLGIAIGIAAMVAVLAISESSKADLLADLDKLGTNLLTVTPGQTLGGDTASLPPAAPGMLGRIGPVERTSATGTVKATVRRTDRIPKTETGSISVKAATTDLLETLGGRLASGRFLDAATERYPVVVLGAVAAERLGISDVANRPQVYLGDQWFSVVGILQPVALASEVDRSALVGFPVAVERLDADGTPSTIYVRSEPEAVEEVRSVLAATANPEAPEEVTVSRPSDALEARAAAKTAFTSLFLG
ncbi:MAG: ABC transporter permease, partial [Actinomycetota bacterium]|nr:ABC transporter permease [Actinomycetota bacterium]